MPPEGTAQALDIMVVQGMGAVVHDGRQSSQQVEATLVVLVDSSHRH